MMEEELPNACHCLVTVAKLRILSAWRALPAPPPVPRAAPPPEFSLPAGAGAGKGFAAPAEVAQCADDAVGAMPGGPAAVAEAVLRKHCWGPAPRAKFPAGGRGFTTCAEC